MRSGRSPAPPAHCSSWRSRQIEPHSPAEVNTKNESRGPLLLMASKKDHTVEPVLVHSALKQYRKSSAITELIDYDDRGHSLVVDGGAPQLMEDSLAWLDRHGRRGADIVRRLPSLRNQSQTAASAVRPQATASSRRRSPQ